MNTERKLIFDIDGTIVTEARDGRIIPDSTRTALRKLQQNGHLCFINTDERLLRLTNLFYSCKWMGLSVAVVHILRITIMYLLNIRYRLILVIAY